MMADAEEGGRLAAETSQPFWATRARAGESMPAGMRGDEARADALASAAEAAALPIRAGAVLSDVQQARGLTVVDAGVRAHSRFRRGRTYVAEGHPVRRPLRRLPDVTVPQLE
jgi:hypothetical protein